MANSTLFCFTVINLSIFIKHKKRKHYYKQVISKFRQITSNFFGCLTKKKNNTWWFLIWKFNVEKKITIVKQWKINKCLINIYIIGIRFTYAKDLSHSSTALSGLWNFRFCHYSFLNSVVIIINIRNMITGIDGSPHLHIDSWYSLWLFWGSTNAAM